MDESFNFLGYHIKNRELLIKHESILRFESSLAKIFTAYRHALLQAKNKHDKERAVAYCQWKLNLRITDVCLKVNDWDGYRTSHK